MIGRMTGAATRGLLVALLIATPALILPGVAADSTQITALMALLAGFLTFVEYNSSFPSIVEFRDAPPFNRLRFIALFVTVVMITQVIKSHSEVTLLSGALFSLGTIIGNALDFPYSPVRLAVLMLPETASLQLVETIRAAAGLAYLVAAIALLVFVLIVRVLGWPTRHGAFNVWVNLPLFDPTAGGDVISRLQRDARINIALGFLLPFLIPAMVKLASYLIDPIPFENPQTLIWTVSAWAFLPASMIMRGIAMNKVAGMIEDKRRRTYADAETEAGLQIA
ncbi:membrane protein [Sulfitobacter mediterraneus]|uniref:Membrane protein n=2 Tax=Sulfitobacter mediterraneus TaxID=83219 RepID=A0A061SX26_9RHOB|nr:membrane protein [Sulfitobacter mediterraneus]